MPKLTPAQRLQKQIDKLEQKLLLVDAKINFLKIARQQLTDELCRLTKSPQQ